MTPQPTRFDPPALRSTRVPRYLFLFYLVIIGVTLVVVLASPAIRGVSYAPVRELLLPPPAPIELYVLYSTEKGPWLDEVVPAFERSRPTVGGRPVQLKLQAMGSREMYLDVLNGVKQPDLISPASSLQISALQDLSRAKNGAPLVRLNDAQACRSVVRTPLAFVAWRDRADVLFSSAQGKSVWPLLHGAVVDDAGWSLYGHPEWGLVKYYHTDPRSSNSGLMALLSMTYDYFNKTGGLKTADIGGAEFQKWFRAFEGVQSEFESSTGPLMDKMVAFGPSKYDIVAAYEATAIQQFQNATQRSGELRVLYPPATVWSDHPFCTLNAPWVTPEKAEAARLFVDFLVSREAQDVALSKYGFRPVDPRVPLDDPQSPFVRYRDTGLKLALPPEIEVPPGDVQESLLGLWQRVTSR